MKITSTLLIALMLLCSQAYADYSTPNTSVKWSLNDLVTNSGGNVTFSSGAYRVTGIITISATDTLSITTDEVVKFDSGFHLLVKGSLKIDPPTSVVFTASNQTQGFNGIKFDLSPASIIRKLTLEYAISCNVTDCSPVFDSCIFQYNNVHNTNTSFGNGAMALFRSKAVITNCKFLNNKRAAIQGGGNIDNPIYVRNCIFSGNNTTNQNVPQINLGGSGADTIKILNNQFLAASTSSGALSFAPLSGAIVHVVITGNLIQNNRYGINLQGGSAVNALVSYNIIEGNNTAGNPASGGSGIAFSGGSTTSHQNSIVTGNMIKGNLWGITIQNGAKPNLGNLSNADTTDDGKNWFYGNSNTNASTPGIHLYNNSPEDITAQGNYWGSNDPATVEARIFHKTDQSSLGLVDYSSNVLPVRLLSFNATAKEDRTLLHWKVAAETALDRYEIQRSTNGTEYFAAGVVIAKGVSEYSFTDYAANDQTKYYRLKMVDKDGSTSYSQVLMVKAADKGFAIKAYTSGGNIVAVINSDQLQKLTLNVYDAAGKLLGTTNEVITAGNNLINLDNIRANAGVLFVEVIGSNIRKTVAVVK